MVPERRTTPGRFLIIKGSRLSQHETPSFVGVKIGGEDTLGLVYLARTHDHWKFYQACMKVDLEVFVVEYRSDHVTEGHIVAYVLLPFSFRQLTKSARGVKIMGPNGRGPGI